MAADIPLKPIAKKTSIVEDVIREISDYILEGIMQGRIKKGDQIPSERELAERLGVGRSSLREAIKVLIMLGLLEVRSGQGTFITDGTSDFYAAPLAWGIIIGDKSIAELVEARLLLDSEATYLAAQRASSEDLREIEAAFKSMQAAAREGDVEKFIDMDVRFHLAIAKAAHNAVILQTVRAIRNLLELWIKKALMSPGAINITLEEHEKIYRCIMAKDPEGARKSIRDHVNFATKRLQRVAKPE